MTLPATFDVTDHHQAKILIVDDSFRHAASLAELLGLRDYVRIELSTDPGKVAALHLANDYDLILLDLCMPNTNGFAVMERLKKDRGEDYLPVLAMTAHTRLKHRALAAGALDVLIKPYDIDEMAIRVRNTIHVRLLYKNLRKNAEDHKEMALHDELTGLPNRRLLVDRIETALQSARRNGKCVAVMYVDLDGFKGVNDRFGHAYGDALLKLVANRLSNGTRQSDAVGRLGGDEFIMLLPEVKTIEEVTIPASKIIHSLSLPFTVADQILRLSASVGIAVYPHHGNATDELMNQADAALYSVKRSGKNGYRFADVGGV